MNTAKKPLWSEASANAGTIGRNVLDCIGNTPLLRLERLGPNYPNVEFYGKAEWFNPGGSVKDRPALEMIREAERSGQTEAGPDHSGRDQRKYRDRLRHDCRGAGLSRETVLAGERQRRAEENSQGLWRRTGDHAGR